MFGSQNLKCRSFRRLLLQIHIRSCLRESKNPVSSQIKCQGSVSKEAENGPFRQRSPAEVTGQHCVTPLRGCHLRKNQIQRGGDPQVPPQQAEVGTSCPRLIPPSTTSEDPHCCPSTAVFPTSDLKILSQFCSFFSERLSVRLMTLLT